MKVAVIQFAPALDAGTNRTEIESLVRDACADGATLIVLPEESLLRAGVDRSDLAERAEAAFASGVELLQRLAAELGVSIVAGGYEPNGTARPYNTLVAVREDGEIAARYRKLHLYDAFAYRESDYVTPGTDLPPVVELGGMRVGLSNCYDARFPELFRWLLDQGAEMFALSAAWVAGHLKEDHWSVLLRARALENTIWVAASGSSVEGCIGGSMIIDPMGAVRASAADVQTEIVVADVSAERTDAVRRALPALTNRRMRMEYEVV